MPPLTINSITQQIDKLGTLDNNLSFHLFFLLSTLLLLFFSLSLCADACEEEKKEKKTFGTQETKESNATSGKLGPSPQIGKGTLITPQVKQPQASSLKKVFSGGLKNPFGPQNPVLKNATKIDDGSSSKGMMTSMFLTALSKTQVKGISIYKIGKQGGSCSKM